MRLERVAAGRTTNLALLVLLLLAISTGAVAFGIGARWVWWVIAVHAVIGVAIVALSPWKTAISVRGVHRRRPGTAVSIALGLLVLVTLVTGFAHGIGVWTATLAMQLHVAAALACIPLATWHVFARPVRPRRTDLSRRVLLRSAAVVGASVAGAAAIEGVVRATGLPGAERRATGSYERGSFDPPGMPVTQWLNDAVPSPVGPTFRLQVVGPGTAFAWSTEELAAFGDEVRATLDCTGGWYAEQVWRGVRLSRLLGDATEGRSVVVASRTGYARRLPIDEAEDLVLATHVGDAPLSAGHGAPLRLVAPGRRGFWWVKWVERIEVSETPWWWQSPFPLT